MEKWTLKWYKNIFVSVQYYDKENKFACEITVPCAYVPPVFDMKAFKIWQNDCLCKSVKYLKDKYPSDFKDWEPEQMKCETCQFDF